MTTDTSSRRVLESVDGVLRPKLGYRVAIILLLATGAAVSLFGIPQTRRLGGFGYHLDLDVYRIGAAVWRAGGDLYGPVPATWAGDLLPFTYPPLSAVVFSPFTFVPLAAAAVLMTLISLALLGVTVGIWLRSLRAERIPLTPADHSLWWTGLTVVGVALWLEPITTSMYFGQINIVIMALVAADCLLKRPPWPRGLMVGLMAAIKLTPAVFVLFFLVRKDFRATVVTGLSFIGFTAVGFALAPRDSVEYWFSTLFDSDRIGRPMYAGNQSITGVLARLDLAPGARTIVWALLSAAAIALFAYAMWRLRALGQGTTVLGLNALLGLLISPVSWSHHWVWVAPLLLSLIALARRYRLRRFTVLTVVGLVLFLARPQWLLPSGHAVEVDWPLWGQILGSAYVWWALAVAIVMLATAKQLAGAESTGTESAGAESAGTGIAAEDVPEKRIPDAQ